MKYKLVASICVLILGLIVLGWINRSTLALLAVQRVASESLGNPKIDQLKTGLHAAFCGTGSPIPDRTRAGPCVAVIAGGRMFVFDVGEGAAETLNLMGLPPARAEAVFLTHLHSDHFDGLAGFGLLRWTGASAKDPLPLYGPQGTGRIAAGLREAYLIDSAYRVGHHGASVVPPSGYGFDPKPFVAPLKGASAVVFDNGGVKITAFGVDHGPVEPSLGYRIDYQGRSIVISGDTKLCDCVERAAKGADILVHEALSPKLTRLLGEAASSSGQENTAQILKDVENYHTTPGEVAGLATRAKVGAVALTHIVPAIPSKALEPIFLDGARKQFDGPLWVMRDGDIVSILSDGHVQKSNAIWP